MKEKFIRKYMLVAKLLGSHEIPCLSRGIGVVIVDPIRNRIVSTGYNGPCKGVPHHDTKEYLQEIVWPQLTEEDKTYIQYQSGPGGCNLENAQVFADQFKGCGNCPRRLVGAKSGERMEICFGCEHGERNAIFNAIEDLSGFTMLAYCGIPCNDCMRAIVQSGITTIYCLQKPEQDIPGNNGYGFYRSRWLALKAGINIIQLEENWINQNAHTNSSG